MLLIHLHPSPLPPSNPPRSTPSLSRTPLHLSPPRPPKYAATAAVGTGPSPCSCDAPGTHRPAGPPQPMASSAAAVASAIHAASASPVELEQRVERRNGGLLPSPDFQRLCLQQLDLFHAIVHPHAVISVYVRPAGSYLMDRLELRRIAVYPSPNPSNLDDIVILIVDFCIPTGLRAAETSLSSQQVHNIPEHKASVFPMVKHPFIVGFLVAELPTMHVECLTDPAENEKVDVPVSPLADGLFNLPSYSDKKAWGMQAVDEYLEDKCSLLTVDQKKSATKIALSLAMAYVMDQKATLLQQSSWQNNIRMSNLVEQIRAPLSSIRTLSKMLSAQVNSNEISYDIFEDILVQGDQMRNTLQQLQDAVYLTKANIVHYNDTILEKMKRTKLGKNGKISAKAQEISGQEVVPRIPEGSIGRKDIELPMPPLALTALRRYEIRPSNISLILEDLVLAAQPLAEMQQRSLQLTELSTSLEVAVEESALRQALSNLIEGALLRTRVGGTVEVLLSGAPAGGALIFIDDDGPDMHYMTQMHSLTPFGSDLFSDGMVEDNMTWNFIAGLTVAREILESYGCVVRVISPRSPEAALGVGGTRIELWFPQMPTDTNSSPPSQLSGQQH